MSGEQDPLPSCPLILVVDDNPNIKFTPAGGRVDVDVTGNTDAIVVCVRDTGPGIAPDDLPRLFQKYWQGNRQAHQSGVGLGLAIAKEIVLAHQGRIWADSQPGDGSRFFISIPRAPVTHSGSKRSSRHDPRVASAHTDRLASLGDDGICSCRSRSASCAFFPSFGKRAQSGPSETRDAYRSSGDVRASHSDLRSTFRVRLGWPRFSHG